MILSNLRQHPELATFDDDGLRLFCDVLGLEMYRNWDGMPATDLAGAWRIRQHLDDQRTRQAEADNLAAARAELDDQLRLGPLHRRLEAKQRRQEALAAIEAADLPDERWVDYERQADERAAIMFEAPQPKPEPDNRSLIERLKAKGK